MELEDKKQHILQLLSSLKKEEQKSLLKEIKQNLHQNNEEKNFIFDISDLKLILDKFPFPIVLSDIQDNNLYVNSLFEEKTGYNLQDIATRADWERRAYPNEQKREKLKLKLKKTENGLTTPHFNFFTGKSGQILHFFFQSIPITDQLTITICEDASDKYHSDDYLKKTKERFQEIAEFFPFPIVVTDEKGKFKYVNPIFTQDLGYTIEDFPDNRAWSLQVYPDIEYRNQILLETRQPGYDPYGAHERIITCKNGEKKTMIFQNISIGKEDFTFLQDITAQRKIEKEAQKQELAYREIVENSRDMIFLVDSNILMQKINPVVTELLGFTEEEVINHPAFEFIVEDFHSLVKQNIQAKQEKKQDRTLYELDLKKKNGGTISVEVMSRLIYRENKFSGILVIARDIGYRKMITEERFRQQRIESIGLLAGGLAHDFNNILVSILGNIDLLQIENTNFTPDQKEIFHDLESATLHARDLAKQLLTFSKGGAPILKLESIEQLIRDSANFVLRGSNCKCVFDFQSNLPTTEFDFGQMNQVFNNLIINARQSMPKGGTINITVKKEHISAKSLIPLKKGEYIKIQIQDHGIGIPKEYQHKIFNPYFTTKPEGNGLGLTMSYSIIKKHAGHITFRSEKNYGTIFDIYLPITKDKKIISTSPSISKKINGRILVLDDDPKIHKFLQRVFSKFGYDMESCYDGAEIIGILNQNHAIGKEFDLVFMDLTIPGGIGGKIAVQQVHEIYPELKVIVFSGYSTDPILAQHKDYGFCDYLVKPFTLQQLKEKCEKWI
ncbi:Sensor histidine kinase RcsC [Candidatus Lokiarchaeum ossiferum]|uniref:Sensor histidine kinase RcsC n=1 Tax=Candidatus Lokiarchaeum ossiferum TaxID=2951803 RepID=A0ABY6HUZ6_9ARCH|nr:Sensor histidine kinase RcsC [Candidatus Lokiarchaeum sp. B-35]